MIVPLRASGASQAVVNEIEAACQGLGPFEDQSIKDFATFLAQAEHYHRSGEHLPKAKATPKKAAAKATGMTADDALQTLRDLYDRAADDGMSHGQIHEEVLKLNKLNKGDLDKVIQDFGLSKAKTKPLALEAIEKKISDRRNSHLRVQSIG